MKRMFICIFLCLVFMVTNAFSEVANLPVIVEAESGDVGPEFDTLEDDGMSYITILTDYDETTGTASYPGQERTTIYEVTFADTGTYDLFARVRVGSGGYNDDSFFYGDGFGDKDGASASGWITSNGLASAGFSEDFDVVRDPGGQGSNVWKWVNLSRNPYQGGAANFEINSADELTQTFSIGARENGLDFDKFAFGKTWLYFTVANLDSVQKGSETDPNDIYEPPTREPLAKGNSKYLGNVWSPTQLYRFNEYWNQVIPGNPGKWGSVEGTRDVMNWGPLDEAYALAKDNNFSYRHHVLIWGNQQPEWMETLSTEEQLDEIKEWFAAVAERYPEIDVLEVVNEPLHDPPNKDDDGGGNYINALGGDNDLYGTGWDWVIKSFELAHEYFPETTQFIINDYSIPNSNSSTTQYLAIINLLQERNLIDGIGVQGHAFSTRGSMTTVKANLDRLAETGLPIIVTEMNIDGGETNPTEQDQLDDYKRIFPTFWEHPGVVGISLSGWRPGMGNTDAILINANGSERPAMEWLSTFVDTSKAGMITSVKSLQNTPEKFAVSNNYPNPFNPATVINYDVAKTSHVNIEVYDITGELVTKLVNDVRSPGSYTVTFNAKNLSSGIYFYCFNAGSFSETKRMILIK